MMNLGLPEILVIGALALLVFGPKRLPELAKSLGKGIRDFKKALEGGGNEESETPPPTQASHSAPPPAPGEIGAGTTVNSDLAAKEAEGEKVENDHSHKPDHNS